MLGVLQLGQNNQLNFTLGVEYTGGPSLNQFGKDLDQGGAKAAQYAKNMQQAASSTQQLEQSTTQAAKVAKEVSSESGRIASIFGGGGGGGLRRGLGGFIGGLPGFGAAGSLLTAFGGAYGVGAALARGVTDAVRYQDALVQVSLASEQAAGTASTLYDQVIKVGNSLRLDAKEAAGLYLQAEKFKIASDNIEPFVRNTQKMSDTLGISVEQAGEFNYQLQRLPGMKGALADLGGVLKKTTDTFNVSGERLVSATRDMSTVMMSVAPAAREQALREFTAAEGLFADMGIAEGQLYDTLYKFTQTKFDPVQTLASRAGFSVEAVRSLIQSGEVGKAVGIILKGIKNAVTQHGVSERLDIASSMLGLDANVLAKMSLAFERGIIPEMGRAADAGADYMEKRWTDMTESVALKLTTMTNALSNINLASMSSIVSGLGAAADAAAASANKFLEAVLVLKAAEDKPITKKLSEAWDSLDTTGKVVAGAAGLGAAGILAKNAAAASNWIWSGGKWVASRAAPLIAAAPAAAAYAAGYGISELDESVQENTRGLTETGMLYSLKNALHTLVQGSVFGSNTGRSLTPEEERASYESVMKSQEEARRAWIAEGDAKVSEILRMRGVDTGIEARELDPNQIRVAQQILLATPAGYSAAVVDLLKRLVQAAEENETAHAVGDYLSDLGQSLIKHLKPPRVIRGLGLDTVPPDLSPSTNNFDVGG